jgi:hypothetical protein
METFTTALFSAFLLPVLLIGAVPMFIYVYAILRWRAGSREEPGIGSYSLVLMFRLIALLLGAGALSLLLYAAFSSRDQEELTRVCWPILVASIVFLGIQFLLGSVLGPAQRFVEARRIFGGGLVAISGLVMFAALVALLVTLWEEVPEETRAAEGHADRIKAFGTWLFCFGSIYVTSSVRMARAAGWNAGRPTPP